MNAKLIKITLFCVLKVLSTVDKRLQCIQDELKVERQTYRKKQDEVTRLSTDLQGVSYRYATLKRIIND